MSHESERWIPPITEQMREQARQTPDSWLCIVDPGYADYGDDVPPEGVVGAYQIDESGEIAGQFQHNDRYRPSGLALSVPEPTNELERVLHRIAAGEVPESELPAAVLNAEVLLYSPDGADDAVYAAEMADGSQIVPGCTSASRVPQNWPAFRAVPGQELPDLLGGLDLGLNLDDVVQAVIPNSALIQVAAAADTPQ